jgi:hypothetical protein
LIAKNDRTFHKLNSFQQIKFYFYHVEIFYVKDITDKKVAGQNQEVELVSEFEFD